jgi:hypothetical protein
MLATSYQLIGLKETEAMDGLPNAIWRQRLGNKSVSKVIAKA